jgi:hypothetical protein
MQIRAYTLEVHAGHAPCWMYDAEEGVELLSLANCKPPIRRVAREGDWIAGVTPKRMDCRLAYLMKVEQPISRQTYWDRYGRTRHDSIYKTASDGTWSRLVNPWHTDEDSFRADLSSPNVLLSKRFYVFAQSYTTGCKEPRGLELPDRFSALSRKGMRGYGRIFELPDNFVEWIEAQHRLALRDFKVIRDFGGCGCWDRSSAQPSCLCQ